MLLQTVSELRLDLERTINKMRGLEDQNQQLSRNYNNCKDELIETRKKYNEARENYMQTVAEKVEAERMQESFMERLKTQLIEKTKDFEQIRDKLVPHDIDQIRIKVQEELEIQHKQQVQSVEHQLELQRNQFYEIRREAERTKAEYDAVIKQQQQEMHAIRTEREEVESELRSYIAKLKEAEFNPGQEEKSRLQLSQLNETKHLLELSKEEVKVYRQERDHAVYQLQSTLVSHQEAIARVRAQCAALQAQSAGLEERKGRLTSEMDAKDTSIRTLKESLQDLTERFEASMRKHADDSRRNRDIQEDNANQIEQLKHAFDQERQELEESLENVQDRMAERDEMLRKAHRETSEMQLRAESIQADLKRSSTSQTQEMRKKYAQVETELATARHALKVAETKSANQYDHERLELDGLQSELSRVKREKETLHIKIREMEGAIDTSKRELTSHKHDLNGRVEVAQRSQREYASTVKSLEGQLRASQQRGRQVDQALAAAKDTNVQQELRLAEQSRAMDALKLEFQKQSKATYERLMEDMKKKLRSSVTKERKRAEAYKEKAVEAHNRSKGLETELNYRMRGDV